jgi:hypothetical protein
MILGNLGLPSEHRLRWQFNLQPDANPPLFRLRQHVPASVSDAFARLRRAPFILAQFGEC